MADWRGHISVNPKVMFGKPCIAGTRIPVRDILDKLAADITVEQILRDYPTITREDVMAALAYAADVIGCEEVIPTEAIE
ncbi:MAG: DUF433 domain-containing protein [Armatimonadota bacterium]|nr:DUF433 domain-containing protein [Armatimonadota bacterium]